MTQPGREWKCVAAQVVDNIEAQVEEGILQTFSSTNARRIAAHIDQLRFTVNKILQKILRCYFYKLLLEQQLLSADLDS